MLGLDLEVDCCLIQIHQSLQLKGVHLLGCGHLMGLCLELWFMEGLCSQCILLGN